MSKLVIETCPLMKEPCRHCSIETTTRPFTRVTKNPKTGLYDSAGLGKIVIELGEYCNDAGKYVDTMIYCPVQWDKAKHVDYGLGKKVDPKPKPEKKEQKPRKKSPVKKPVSKKPVSKKPQTQEVKKPVSKKSDVKQGTTNPRKPKAKKQKARKMAPNRKKQTKPLKKQKVKAS